MFKFSKISLDRLNTCDNRLQILFNEVIKYFDCTIICGVRGEEEQNLAFDNKKSKLKWPESKHNKIPSLAVDVAPYINGSISWDKTQCSYFAGFVKGIASMYKINIIWGGDWNSDNNIKDNKFNDLVHFEIK